MKTKIPHLILAAGVMLFMLPGTASAQTTFTWDGGGGDGNWTTATNWDGDVAPVDGGAFHNFVFDGTSQLNSNVDITPGNKGLNTNDLIFNAGAGAFILSGSSFDLLGTVGSSPRNIDTAKVINNSTNTQTINSDIWHRTDYNTGLVFDNTDGGAIVVNGVIQQFGNVADDVTIQGNGTVTFNGVNTYTQDTTLDSGTLIVGNSEALGTGTITLAGGTLRNDGNSVTLDEAIVVSGDANTFASGANVSLTGAITGSGTLNVGGTGSGQTANNRVNIAANTLNGFTGTLNLDNTENYIDIKGTTTSAKLVTSGATSGQYIRLWGNSTFSELSGTGGYIAGDIKTLTIDQSTDTTYAGRLGSVNSARTLTFVKSGTGSLTLSGANDFFGNVTVNAGTLKIGSTTALGVVNTAVTKVTVNSGGTVDFNGQRDATYGYTISGTGVDGNGALVNNGATIGTNRRQASNITLANDASIGGTGDWALLASSYGPTTLDLAGNTLTKSGANTVTLVNATVTAGSLQIDEGTLAISRGGSLSTSAAVVNNANLNYGTTTASDTYGLSSSTTGTGTLTGTAKLLQLNGNITQGTVNLTSDTIGGTYGQGIELVSDTTITADSITLTGDLGRRTRQGGTLALDTSATNGAINLDVSIGRSGDWFGFNSFTADAGTGTLTVSGANAGSGGWRGTSSASLAGTLDISSSFTISGSGAGPLDLTATGNSSVSGNLGLGSATSNTWTVNSGLTMDVSGNVSGTNAAITKNGTGTLTLTGANTYTGDTTVSAGTLSLDTGYTHTGGGAYTVEGGTLKIADGVSVGSAMTIGLGGVISPGNSPGTASTGAQTWNDGGSYLWEINASNDAGGTIGTDPGWDWLDITGALDLTNLTQGGFTIDINSLTSGNIAGDAVGFDTWTKGNPGDVDYSFIIATASSGITGFDAADFILDSSGFSNAPSWEWGIVLSGGDLVLEAYAVPEPSSTALLGLGGLALALRRRRS